MIVYTDGSSAPHTTMRGGWAWVSPETGFFCHGSEEQTTNMRMEMMGVLHALLDHRHHVFLDIYTDSNVVIHARNKGWTRNWRAQGWMNGDEPRKNADLWKRLDAEWWRSGLRLMHVKGHSNVAGNELADRMAGLAKIGAIPITYGTLPSQL